MKTRDITDTALAAAALTAAKIALASIANVEIVTLLIIVFSLSLGFRKSFSAAVIFTVIQILIYGVHIWIIMYIVHWPLIALLASLIRHKKHRYIYASAIGIVMTVLFGAFSTLVETLAFGGAESGNFAAYYSARYISGLVFFLMHIVSNAVIIPLGIYPLTEAMEKITRINIR